MFAVTEVQKMSGKHSLLFLRLGKQTHIVLLSISKSLDHSEDSPELVIAHGIQKEFCKLHLRFYAELHYKRQPYPLTICQLPMQPVLCDT